LARNNRGQQGTTRDAGSLERVNQELKRRTRVARIFPNEASLLRLLSALLSALLAETSDAWESSKSYLDMNPSSPPFS
jgi:transposase-like protein